MHSGLKSVAYVAVLMALVVGLTACAKYPVVAESHSSPSAANTTPAPTR